MLKIIEVAGFIRKELGSCHSILTTSEKLNRLKKSTILLCSVREEVYSANCCPQGRRDRQVHTGHYGLLEQRLASKTTVGTSEGVEKPELQLMNCWRLSGDNSED